MRPSPETDPLAAAGNATTTAREVRLPITRRRLSICRASPGKIAAEDQLLGLTTEPGTADGFDREVGIQVRPVRTVHHPLRTKLLDRMFDGYWLERRDGRAQVDIGVVARHLNGVVDPFAIAHVIHDNADIGEPRRERADGQRMADLAARVNVDP